MARRSASRFYRGEAGMRHAEKVKEQQDRAREQAGNQVFRFFMRPDDSREIIILDDKPDFFMWEHNVKQGGKFGNFSGCCKEWETCPACEEYPDYNSYFGMFLTCIDLTEYVNRQDEVVEFSRKLVVVKPSQQKKFSRLHERHGTLRGMKLEMSRDGDKDPAIGNDIEFIEFVDEDELQDYIRVWEDRDGKEHEEDCSEPYDYEEMFVEPTPEAIAEQLGIRYEPSPGSSKANRRALDDEEGMEEDEEKPQRSRRSARKGKKSSEEDEERSSRSSRRARSSRREKPSSRGGAKRRRAVDDEEENTPWDEEEEGQVEPEKDESNDKRSRRRRPAGRSAGRRKR